LGKDFAHLGDVLQELLVQGVSNLQPADECECGDLLTRVGDFSQLALEEIDVLRLSPGPILMERR